MGGLHVARAVSAIAFVDPVKAVTETYLFGGPEAVVEVWIDVVVPSLGTLLSVARADVGSHSNPPRAGSSHSFPQAGVLCR